MSPAIRPRRLAPTEADPEGMRHVASSVFVADAKASTTSVTLVPPDAGD